MSITMELWLWLLFCFKSGISCEIKINIECAHDINLQATIQGDTVRNYNYWTNHCFLPSRYLSSLLTLIHWLCRSPSPQVTMTESQMSRFVTILRSDHCFPMGSGLEDDMQLGVFRISGSMPCPWHSFSLHTHKTFVFLSSLTKLFLFHFTSPPKML